MKCIKCFEEKAETDFYKAGLSGISRSCKDCTKKKIRVLKANGKCPRHPGRDSVNGKTMCEACLEYLRNRGKQKTKKFKEMGICYGCKNSTNAGWCNECALKYRAARYGITTEQYVEIVSNPCQVCGSTEKPNLDHNHKTGKVRGILCGKCNRALGLLQESLENVKALAAYLEKAGG